MWRNEDEKHKKNLEVNTILILEFQMTNKFVSNNYRSVGFFGYKY